MKVYSRWGDALHKDRSERVEVLSVPCPRYTWVADGEVDEPQIVHLLRERSQQKNSPVDRGRSRFSRSGMPIFSANLADVGLVCADTSVPSGKISRSNFFAVPVLPFSGVIGKRHRQVVC